MAELTSDNSMVSMTDLSDKELYLNRELSLLKFNQRVLMQALDESIPLLERLRFICIFSSNMDEFFEVRVAGIKQSMEFPAQYYSIDGKSPEETLDEISELSHDLAAEQYRILTDVIIPALQKEKIHFLDTNAWNEAQQVWTKKYFRNEILPILTPIGLDLTHPFPRLVNKTLNFIVSLEGKDAFGRDSGLAVIHAPRTLPRVILMPQEEGSKQTNFVLLSSLVHAYADLLFPGMTVTGCYQFRLTRNSELFLNEELADDLLHAVKGKLSSRRFGEVVRLEIINNCPDEICHFLLKKFSLTEQAMYRVTKVVNISRLSAIIDQVQRPDLLYPTFTPGLPLEIKGTKNIFETLKKHDILLHHPYQSFEHVEAFVRQAANDNKVLAIKLTLYRTEPKSPLVDALVDAAKSGKEITAVIEIRARFDEADNIILANRLQEAGALVVYGVVDYKTHAKMTLVIRRENNKNRRYVHLGTGNYHSINARRYSDYGLITSDKEIANDVLYVFQQLTGMGRASRLRKLFHAPFTFHKMLLQHIEREIEHAKAGKSAHIIMKMNGLTEKQLIDSLYNASQHGVKIDLIVRGICCLRPGVKGISDNIKVRSIVGQFLEHARVYYFQNNDSPELYLASADGMERNCFRRVEVCFPIENQHLKDRIKKECLNLQLRDNTQSWQLQADGTYKCNKPTSNQQPISAQQTALDMLSEQTTTKK